MSNENNDAGGPNQPPVTPPIEVIQDFIETQKQEIQLKTQELEVKKTEIIQNQEIAKESISAQLEDSRIKAAYFTTTNLRKSVLIGMCILGGLGFLMFSMYTGQTEFAERIMDILIGAAGGFFLGKYINFTSNED